MRTLLTIAALPLLSTACSRPSVVDLPPEDSPPGDSAPGDSRPSDSQPWDPDTEDLPGNDAAPWDTPALCSASIACEQTIPDEPKVPCELRLTSASGLVLYEGWAGFEERGRSSNSFPKHQYSFELWRDPGGEAVQANFYGMGWEADWILNGNYADRALFRNKLGYDLYNAFGGEGAWAAESVLCQLELNGEWLGVFTLSEKVKRDGERIAISDATDGTSWIVKNDDSDGFMNSTGFYAYWQLVWPGDDALPGASAAVTADIRAFQAAIAGPDPDATWALVDLDSAVDFVILHELSRNNDAYYLSVHMWKDADGLIRFTPWDLDLAFGGYPISSCGWDGWVNYRSPAITAFAASPAFRDRLTQRWSELRAGPLGDEAVLARMDRYTEVMGETLDRNFEVWPITEIDFCWSGDCYLCPVESVAEEQAWVREWTVRHMAWMDENIATYP
jgi:hypothetical protein